MDDWLTRLERIFDYDTAHHIAQYVSQIDNAKDAVEYLSEFVDHTNPRQKAFLDELYRDVQIHTSSNDRETPRNSAYQDPYMKKPLVEASKGRGKITITADQMQHVTAENGKSKPATASQGQGQNRRSDDKFIPLFSEQGEKHVVAMLPGRHACNCVATKHKLINNCFHCGRIVCEQEGSGPCFFCGELVSTKEDMAVLARNSKKSEKLRNQLTAVGRIGKDDKMDLLKEGWEKALKNKEMLLEFDKTSARRTKVIDDEMDYFHSDDAVWLSKTEKEKLQRREEELRAIRHQSKLEKKMVYDFAGRKLVDPSENVQVYDASDAVLEEVMHKLRVSDTVSKRDVEWKEEDFPLVNPAVAVPPEYVQEKTGQKSSASYAVVTETRKQALRLQDEDLSQLRDNGFCLSMHQPWASLLVSGIKLHEGRTWYSPHRGRLWIASTAKKLSTEEIQEVESQYTVRSDTPVEFPTSYPVGCLLGSVDVVDVLPQEEYKQQFSNGESSSPYVFICSNPFELIVRFPIKGEPKIYKLDKHVHEAAKKGLRKRVGQ